MSNPVQRGGTSANTSDNACAITIIAGQQSFQVNFVYFLRNILSKDIHTSRIPSHVPRFGHLLHRYSLIHCQLSILTNNCYSTDLTSGVFSQFSKITCLQYFYCPSKNTLVIYIVSELVDYACLRNVYMIAWCTSCFKFEILSCQCHSESTGACEVKWKLFQTFALF